MKFSFVAVVGLALAASPAAFFSAKAAESPHATRAVRVSVDGRAVSRAIADRASGALKDFYASRNNRPLWADDGIIGTSAQVFLRILDEAALDGLKPSRYRPDRIREMIANADSGNAEDVARAEVSLSKAFARYVRDVRRVKSGVGVEFADRSLQPGKLDYARILRAAAHVRSFDRYLKSMGWMSPHYVEVRDMLRTARTQGLDPHVIETIRLNLERTRYLPAPSVRHVVVDAGSARLWYYQAGEQAGTMRVVVGAKETQTPLLVGSLNYAVLNPYWNVPDYLVRNNVAAKILAGRTLASMHMEALSDWSATPARLDPAVINWRAVASGEHDLRVRELPGPHNSMGRIKFIFPNDHGIYLHDTPNRDLFAKDDRHLSNGCIRLEKAWVLGRWMMGKSLEDQAKGAGTEKAVPMTASVPVYLTYVTVTRDKKGRVVVRPDIYGLDQSKR